MTAAFPSAFTYTKRQSRNGSKPFDIYKDSAAKNAHNKKTARISPNGLFMYGLISLLFYVSLL